MHWPALKLLLLLGIAEITWCQMSMGVPQKRRLMDTPWGQLHYVSSHPMAPDLPTLALYHSNPHSHTEFIQFLNQPGIKGRFNFVAFDYFGCGGSDDCIPPACGLNPYDGPHPYVTIQEFVRASLSALEGLRVTRNIACLGHLKGGSAAIECAAQLGSRAVAMMAMDALYFLPEAVPIVKKYTNHTLHTLPVSSGQHLLDAWFQPSVAPCDFVNGTYCAAWQPDTLAQNELKTLDRIRAFGSQWQYIMAGLGYNAQLINRTTIARVSGATPSYLGWGSTAVSMWVSDGFSDGVAVVNKAWREASANRTKIELVERASEGSMVQNASHYATVLLELLGP